LTGKAVENLFGSIYMERFAALARMQWAAAAQMISAASPQILDPIVIEHCGHRNAIFDGFEIQPLSHRSSGRLDPPPQLFTLMLFEHFHVQVARRFDPVLVDLRREGTHQPQATGRIRKDSHH
jgi:hypothetical protein